MGRAGTKHNRVNNVSLVLRELLRTSVQGGSTIEELADLCGVSTRNIYRYFNEIEVLGFELIRPNQLKSRSNSKGRYRLNDQVLMFSQTDLDLVLMLGHYMHKERLYCEQLKLILEVFIRCLAGKYAILLPVDWKIK